MYQTPVATYQTPVATYQTPVATLTPQVEGQMIPRKQ
jgi:hypothetical protein